MSLICRPIPCLLAFSTATTLIGAPALAATTVYTTQGSFMAAVQPGAYTENFNSAAGQQLSFSFSGGGFAYTVTAPPQGLGDDVYLSGNFLSNFYSNSLLTLTFTGGNPTAIGGNFYVSNVSNAFVPAAPVTITLSDGTVTTFTPGAASDYRGFTSTVAISSLVMSAPGGLRYNTIDNLTVGRSTVAAVPEPGSYALMAGGLAALAAMAWRRRV